MKLCSAAKAMGVTECEKKVSDEVAAGVARQGVITTRKAMLQTCGLPIPDARLGSVLAGTEDEFAAAHKAWRRSASWRSHSRPLQP